MATRWIRCRGGLAGMSLGCRLENAPGCCEGCCWDERTREPAAPGPRAWLRGMKQPLPRRIYHSPFPTLLFSPGMLPSRVLATILSGDRDIVRGDLVADQNRDAELTSGRTTRLASEHLEEFALSCREGINEKREREKERDSVCVIENTSLTTSDVASIRVKARRRSRRSRLNVEKSTVSETSKRGFVVSV